MGRADGISSFQTTTETIPPPSAPPGIEQPAPFTQPQPMPYPPPSQQTDSVHAVPFPPQATTEEPQSTSYESSGNDKSAPFTQPSPVPFPPPNNHMEAPQPVPFPPQATTMPSSIHGGPQPYISASPQFQTYPQVANNFQQAQYQGMQVPYRPVAQVPIGLPQYPTESWKTGLFSCMDDPLNALVTVCFPCVTFGQIAEIIDNGQTSCATSGLIYGLVAAFIGCPCIMSCSYRSKLRSRYGLIETPAPDWLTHCFCECCALCQEYRELQACGLDPAIGWHGNLVRSSQNMQMQQQQTAMTPPMNQAMMG